LLLHYFSSRQKREGRSMDRPWYVSPGIRGNPFLRGRKILIIYTLLLPLDLVFHFWTMAVPLLSVFLRSHLVWQSQSLCGRTSNRWCRLFQVHQHHHLWNLRQNWLWYFPRIQICTGNEWHIIFQSRGPCQRIYQPMRHESLFCMCWISAGITCE
jgi:hypothetical protein